MSFFGKKFQKTGAENVKEIMDELKVPQKLQDLLARPDSITTFEKNDDGSIQYVIEAAGIKGMDQKIILGTEQDYTSPDGQTSKNIFTLEGNVLKAVMRGHGKVVHFTRTFEENSFTMEIEIEGFPTKGIVKYKAV